MKNMKKIFALVMALAMVLCMAVNVSAAQIVDVQTDGHVYNVYQVFSGSQTAEDATLTGINWGAGVDGAALLNALKTDEKMAAFFGGCADANAVAKVLADNFHNETLSNAFANIAVKFLTNPVMNGEKALEINDSTTTVDLDAGYYLFLDVTENLEQGHAYNPALLQVTKSGNITIQKKATVPEVEKSIHDGSEQGIQKKEAMIGSTVKFQITSTLASGMGHYAEYEYIIHDDIPVGMEVVADSVKVYLLPDGVFANMKEVTAGFAVTAPNADCTVFGQPEEATVENGFSDNSCDLEIAFENLREPITVDGQPVHVDANDKFYVTYEALVTPAAEPWIDANVVILHNDAVLEFSNNPNWNPDDPENEGKEPPKGITPESDAEVFLTKVIVEKVDENKNPLKGAEFELRGTGMKPVITIAEIFVETTEFEDGEEKYWLLTDGTYTTTDPAAEGIDTSTYVDVNTTYALRVTETVKLVEEDVRITVAVGEDGKVTFAGLGAGTYYLTETKAPAGYEMLKDPIKLVISFNPENGHFSYDWRHEGAATALSATLSLQVVNTKGNVLPETGGMGTTLFYAFGGIMVLAATVLLITKKRMAV